MSRPSWYLTGSVLQRKKRVVRDGSGNVVLNAAGNDTYTTTDVTLTGVLIEPRLSVGTENTAGQEHVGAGLDLYCVDVEADIASTDQFFYHGQWWDVDGPVNRYRESRLGNDFSHVNLERITG